MTGKVSEGTTKRNIKTPKKLSPSDWKAGLRSLQGLGRQWAAHRDKRPLVAKNSRPAKSNDPSTWSSWQEAAAFYERTQHDEKAGAGLMVKGEGEGLVALDLDHCLGPDGLPLRWAQPILERFVGKTYVEVSLSGKGAHVLFKGYRLPEGVKRSKAKWRIDEKDKTSKEAVEFFVENHFITLSGNVYLGSDEVSACQEELDQFLQESGLLDQMRREHEAPQAAFETPEEMRQELNTAVMALQAIDPDSDRDTWLQVGMALHGAFGSAGWAPWYEWSRTGQKFVPGDCEKVWKSFGGGVGVTLGTLYHHAREAGWDGSPIPMRRNSAQEDFAEFAPQGSPAAVPATPAAGDVPPAAPDVEDLLGSPRLVEDYVHGKMEDWQACRLHLSVRGKGKTLEYYPSEGEGNIGQYLIHHPEWKGRLRWNERTLEPEMDGSSRILDLHDLGKRVLWFMGWKRSPSEIQVFQAVKAVASLRPYDPVQDYLNGLRWDGTHRLDGVCKRTGLEDTPITRRMMRRWLIGAVARAMSPGVEMHNMLVLHGLQAEGKTTFFKKLAVKVGQWHTESKIEMAGKDGQMNVTKFWIVEVAELSSMARAAVEDVKVFISQAFADFRPPYGRRVETFPRRCVFAGTTNEDEFLRDGTGSRRFWVIGIESELNYEWMTEEEVGQVWAEAVVAYRKGERWWDSKEEAREVMAKNEGHYQSVGLDAMVEQVLANVKTLGVTSDAVLRTLVSEHGVSMATPRKAVAQSMERAGWKRSRIRPLGRNGPQPWVFRRPGTPDPAKDEKVREALRVDFKRSAAEADFAEEPSQGSGESPGEGG